MHHLTISTVNQTCFHMQYESFMKVIFHHTLGLTLPFNMEFERIHHTYLVIFRYLCTLLFNILAREILQFFIKCLLSNSSTSLPALAIFSYTSNDPQEGSTYHISSGAYKYLNTQTYMQEI